nr:MAG TPA: hypothetical protein [Caudoviricetes sp.]
MLSPERVTARRFPQRVNRFSQRFTLFHNRQINKE